MRPPHLPLLIDLYRRVRRAAARLVSALVLHQKGIPGDPDVVHALSEGLLAAAQDEDRPDVRAASLRAAADVLAWRWKTTPLNLAAGLPNNAASLVAAAAATDARGSGDEHGSGGDDLGVTDAHGAVLRALAVLASPSSTAVVDGVARRVAVAAEKAAEFLGGARGGGASARGFATHAATATAAVRAATGLVALWSSSCGQAPPPVPVAVPTVVPRVVQATCVILGAAERAGDAELARDCRGLLARVAAELPSLPEGAAALGAAVRDAVRRVGGEDGEPPPTHEEIIAVLKGHTLLIEAAMASLRAADKSAAHRRRVFAAAAHALAKQLEPPPSIVASTARADPALALVADPAAAASAPESAAAAAARMRLLASIVDVLPPKERLPPRRRRHREGQGLEQQSFPSPSAEIHSALPDAASGRRAPLIIELIDDEAAPSASAASGDVELQEEELEEENEGGKSSSSSGREHDVDDALMSVATAAALAAAGYARGGVIHGAGGLPGWSSAEASEAAYELLARCFTLSSGEEDSKSSKVAASAMLRAATGGWCEFDDVAREQFARCLGEAAPSLAHCLNPEPEPRWGGEPDRCAGRPAGPPAPELPAELTRTLQAASVEGAVVAAVRLRWMLAAAGYPWVGRVNGGGEDPGGGVVSRVVPCVLRAMDHQSAVVRREGCAALVALVASTTRTELRWHGAALLDAAASTLTGSTPEVFGAAAAGHVRAAVAVCGDDPRDPGLMSALDVMMEAANSRDHEPAVAVAWVAEAPALISAVKLCAAAHLARLLPPLLGWLHAVDDATALGAATCLELLCKMTWPRVPSHAAAVWPDVARAYVEADARGSCAATATYRAALERVVAVVQLAAGERFEAAWRADADGGRTGPQLAPLLSYLEQLPERTAPTDWVAAARP